MTAEETVKQWALNDAGIRLLAKHAPTGRAFYSEVTRLRSTLIDFQVPLTEELATLAWETVREQLSTTTGFRVLSQDEGAEILQELVASKHTRPVRFLHEGCAVNIITGEKCSKGTNVMYHPVYWNFTKDTAAKIEALTNTKAVWSE